MEGREGLFGRKKNKNSNLAINGMGLHQNILGDKNKIFLPLFFCFFFEVLKCQYIRIQEPIYGVPPPPSVLQKTAHIHTIYAKNAFPIFSKMQRNFAAEFDLFLQHGFIEHNF